MSPSINKHQFAWLPFCRQTVDETVLSITVNPLLRNESLWFSTLYLRIDFTVKIQETTNVSALSIYIKVYVKKIMSDAFLWQIYVNTHTTKNVFLICGNHHVNLILFSGVDILHLGVFCQYLPLLIPEWLHKMVRLWKSFLIWTVKKISKAEKTFFDCFMNYNAIKGVSEVGSTIVYILAYYSCI